jgi:hypothetical protein
VERDRPQQVLVVRDQTRARQDQRVICRMPFKRYAVDRSAGETADRQRVAIAGNPATRDAHDQVVELGIVDVCEGGERGEHTGRCVLDIKGGGIDVEDGRIVHRHDTDQRGGHVAGVHAVIGDHLDEAVFGDGLSLVLL